MADLTIRVPSEHVDAVRDSLLRLYSGVAEALHRAAAGHAAGHDGAEAVRGHRMELADLEDALEQLGWSYDATGPRDVAAHPEVLSDALHGAVIDAAERFASACTDLWRARDDGAAARAALQRLEAAFALFERVQGGSGAP